MRYVILFGAHFSDRIAHWQFHRGTSQAFPLVLVGCTKLLAMSFHFIICKFPLRYESPITGRQGRARACNGKVVAI